MVMAAQGVQSQARPAGVSLELERSVESPAVARAAASGLCQNLGLSPSLRNTCLLLVSEIVSNAVLHSSAQPDSLILFTATAAGHRAHHGDRRR